MATTTTPPNHLIIVCGHAIWAGGPTNGQDESEWLIEDWKKGESPTYTAHIKAGLQALSEDDRGVLVFSGGPTCPSMRLSEARSYANLAAANDYWGLLPAPQIASSQPPPRILTEERALDSYQNILHSLTTFWCTTMHWPARLTIVSHAFKQRRLAYVHCIRALGFPPDRVAFVGIDPPGIGPEVLASEARAVEAWERDPQGRSAELKGKRARRNCWVVSEMIFSDELERARSGIETVIQEDGGEYLVEGGPRPWG
ncbi:hypothetical protein N0V93_000345 [Gnomoniopsis smithogilvyi]|uniref:DUF218 domain-containing protein n=1 Tax=Gnomoniopsis smithogilvyi TaxID=1191159 RepID=A0A9W8Z1R1_9PEZI|nr:hypothetical protein N0V93_000345 [Gnomoniopsis smithogilvyi]